MHVLVTGAAGYVGSVLVDVLLRAGHQVRGVDALAHGPAPSLLLAWGEDEFEFVRADVTDADAMGSAVVDVDAVVHLAAIVGDPACAREPELAKAINVGATRDLVRAARDRDVGRFVFASTCSNYGKLDDPNAFATEDWPLRPSRSTRRRRWRRSSTSWSSPPTASRPAAFGSPRSTASRPGCAST